MQLLTDFQVLQTDENADGACVEPQLTEIRLAAISSTFWFLFLNYL